MGRTTRFVRHLALAFALAAGLVTGSSTSSAQPSPSLTTLDFGIVGPGVVDWPYYLARDRGFLAREGLNVVEVTGNNLQNTIDALVTGDLPIAVLGSDAIAVARGHQLPIKFVAPTIAIDTYSLVTVPSVKSWADLKGKTVLVTTKLDLTGLSFQRMAQAQHLDMNRDFDVLTSGTSVMRMAALKSGNAQGAMLIQPFDLMAEASGMRILAQSADYVKDWLSAGVAVNENWAKTHRPELVRFLRALRDATRYGYAHPQDAIAVLAAATKVDTAVAARTYAIDFTQRHAFRTDGMIDERALANVVSGVLQLGEISQPVPISDLADESYAKEVAAH